MVVCLARHSAHHRDRAKMAATPRFVQQKHCLPDQAARGSISVACRPAAHQPRRQRAGQKNPTKPRPSTGRRESAAAKSCAAVRYEPALLWEFPASPVNPPARHRSPLLFFPQTLQALLLFLRFLARIQSREQIPVFQPAAVSRPRQRPCCAGFHLHQY